MSEPSPRNRPVHSELHPAVYFALVGAAAWFTIAIWGFSGSGYVDWILVVVSGFAFIAVTIPVILSFVGYDGHHHRRQRFRDWASGDFSTWTDRSRGRNAAIEILLPLGAAAIGMTAIAIVFVVEHA